MHSVGATFSLKIMCSLKILIDSATYLVVTTWLQHYLVAILDLHESDGLTAVTIVQMVAWESDASQEEFIGEGTYLKVIRRYNTVETTRYQILKA